VNGDVVSVQSLEADWLTRNVIAKIAKSKPQRFREVANLEPQCHSKAQSPPTVCVVQYANTSSVFEAEEYAVQSF